MWAYIIRRLLLAIPTLFVVTVVAFFIVMLEPKQQLPLNILVCVAIVTLQNN